MSKPSAGVLPPAIGRYRVTGKLGEGGMGVVYGAHDDQLDRPVAIKMVRSATPDPQARERLRREARAAASVSHPNICQLYEIGEDRGELFLAMERLTGEALDERVARGALPVSESLRISMAILSALSAIHRRGLVHRDLKPSNVFLSDVGVKLVDFGVARAVSDGGTETQVELTQPGVFVGTPQWVSPEQLTSRAVDGRSDLFAAGTVLYFMLAGKPMFEGKTAVQIFHAVMHEQPPVLGGGPAVRAVDRVIQRAVAKDPDDRYQTAEAMMSDLRAAHLLADELATAHAVPLTRLIVLPFRVLRPDPETDFLAFSLPDEVTSSLSGLQSLVVRSSVTASRLATEPLNLEEVAVNADVDVVVTGTLLRAGDQVRVNTQLVEAKGGALLWSHAAQIPLGDVFQLQSDLTRRIVDSLAIPLSSRDRRVLDRDVPADGKAYELYLRGNQLSAQATDWIRARDAYQDCLDRDPQYAPAWARLGRIYRVMGLYGGADADTDYERAQSAFAKALEINPDLPVAHNLYTNLEVEVGRGQQAMLRLLRLIEEGAGDAELFAGLVQACRYCDLLDASIAAFERARRLDPAIRTSVAHAYFAKAEYQQAMDTCVEDPPFICAWALALTGRDEEAVAIMSQFEQMAIPKPMLRFVRSARAAIEGDRMLTTRLNWEILRSSRLRDPCAVFYLARNLAAVGDVDHALVGLQRAIDGGFGCFTLLARDPWLDPLRSHPEFSELRRYAEQRRDEAEQAFAQAGGERLLGLARG